MVGRLLNCKLLKQDPTNNANQKIISIKEVGEEEKNPPLSDECRNSSKWWHLTCIPLFVITILLFVMVLLPTLDQVDLRMQFMLNKQVSVSQDSCSFSIVESIPEGLMFPNYTHKNPSTFETWKKLIQMAEHTIEIGSFYWTMRQSPKFPNESRFGDEIYNDLLKAGMNQNITIRIAQSNPTKNFPSSETEYLQEKKAAQVKYLNFDALLGSGVLHTKFWIVDRKHLYVGSANLDWRALNQVKELGIAFYNCSAVAEDLAKVFDVYWIAGNQSTLPKKWPDNLATVYNSKNPFDIELNGEKNRFYISSSPQRFSPTGRNDDLGALLSTIKHAKKFVYISVMDYQPLILFSKHLRFWPDIDDALRKAVVERNVEVRLLISRWQHTKPMTTNFLKSLIAINNFKENAVILVKWFEVPSNGSQSKIPFARVNHNKYMVTDLGAFIGTSNWSGDYFTSTAGVSVVSTTVNGSSNTIQKELKEIFDRDWNSPYARPLKL